MMFRVIKSFVLFVLVLRSMAFSAQTPNESYKIESIQMPEGLTSETGGLDFTPSGLLAACFHRGEVMFYNPDTKEWRLFARGLQDPLGLLAISDSELLVMHQPELTRVRDTDGDGRADLYENLTDDFGISGNYHEFNYGPVEDKEGNLFIALNTASSGDGIMPEVRGKLNLLGRDGKDGSRQMYSVVPYRGWIMKLTPSGELLPFALGFRSPNGLGFDLKGNLFATDNQSDWVPTSTLYHVQEDNFYGHPASLVWKEDWKGRNPFSMSVKRLDSMRTKAAVLFPQGIMANSPSQPLCDITEGKFGPFAGQLFIGEMNRPRIVRVMLERVGGILQGACIPFMDDQGLRMGNNRLAFAPDGSLWVGQTDHGWAGDEGIQRIVYTGKEPMDVYSMNLTANGFDLTFTQPVDAASATDPNNYHFRRYYYSYHKKDESEGIDEAKQFDVQKIPVTNVEISPNGKKVSLTLSDLNAGYIYELKLKNIRNSEGRRLDNDLICYTLNRLKFK